MCPARFPIWKMRYVTARIKQVHPKIRPARDVGMGRRNVLVLWAP
jgi:hypothetical protein